MSQFELENALREATRMDSSLNTSKAGGHKPRKALDNSTLNISAAGALTKLLLPMNLLCTYLNCSNTLYLTLSFPLMLKSHFLPKIRVKINYFLFS